MEEKITTHLLQYLMDFFFFFCEVVLLWGTIRRYLPGLKRQVVVVTALLADLNQCCAGGLLVCVVGQRRNRGTEGA